MRLSLRQALLADAGEGQNQPQTRGAAAHVCAVSAECPNTHRIALRSHCARPAPFPHCTRAAPSLRLHCASARPQRWATRPTQLCGGWHQTNPYHRTRAIPAVAAPQVQNRTGAELSAPAAGECGLGSSGPLSTTWFGLPAVLAHDGWSWRIVGRLLAVVVRWSNIHAGMLVRFVCDRR